MRQQFVDAAGRLGRQPLKHVLQVRAGFVPVDTRGVQQAHDGRRPFARAQAPANSQFDLPSAIGRMWFSTQLFEIGTSPSSTKCVTSPQGINL